MDKQDKLTHLNDQGEAHMVDISHKNVSERTATAQSWVCLSQKTLAAIKNGENKKGDVIAVARVAGIQAAKKSSDLIPLCHPLMLTRVSLDFHLDEARSGIEISATCKLAGKTGVEMEALTAVSVAALTLYDMCKALDKHIVIKETKLISKTGGTSGDWSSD